MNPRNLVVMFVTNPNQVVGDHSHRLVTSKREHVSPAAKRGWCSLVGRTVYVPITEVRVTGSRIRWPNPFIGGFLWYRVMDMLI